MAHNKTPVWWGAPKKFSEKRGERKISWLELFYDLVYVIAISKITQYLTVHPTVSGLLDYTYFFSMIFWGWVNGSLYHDIHGTAGLRTSLMTLWQIMIVAALVITIGTSPEHFVFNATIAVMVMQLYITYLWWSVGIYDKEHRKLNTPYSLCYLSAFALMLLTLFISKEYIRIVFYLSLLLNYLPPFLTLFVPRKTDVEFNLSSSMSERLGLFTIIIFGEVVLGIVNGVSNLNMLSTQIWFCFALAILIVFSLWWLFFTLISDRPCKNGIIKSGLMELTYIPTLMALGVIAVTFGGLFQSFLAVQTLPIHLIKISFSLAISLFIGGIAVLLSLLQYPANYVAFKKKIQKLLFTVSVLFLVFAITDIQISLITYLSTVLILLLLVIAILNAIWYTKMNKV